MIRLKKMLALAIAMIMVICTMNMGVFAASGDLTPDQTITINGLDKDDTVRLYRILSWTESTGWTINPDYVGIVTEGTNYYTPHVKDLVDNKPGVELTKADLENITKCVKDAGKNPVQEKKITASPYTFDTKDAPGMYLALIAPGKSGVIYNPIIVSADFSAAPNTSEIDASHKNMGTSAVAKKETIEVHKESNNDNTHNVGDTVSFTITGQIPAYSNSYEEPKFIVTDTLSDGLTLKGDPTVTCADVTSDITEKTAHGFKVEFDSAGIAALVTYADYTITYEATITNEAVHNVNEDENEVVVEYSNDPKEDGSKGKIKDKTKHYTFTIDGELLGSTGFRELELIKVGLNADGTPAFDPIQVSNGTKVAALDGAEFGLYTTYDGADKETEALLYKNKEFTGKITTENGGLLVIPGLDKGDYFLKELKAPKGYVRDTKVHTININADITNDDTTETLEDGTVVTYKVPVLHSYTITIDGVETATYSATISGSEILESVTGEVETSEIANTKGVELPATGGMGTTIFYVIGTILVLGAGVLLVTRRRMGTN